MAVTTLLIPVDFSIESLNTLKIALTRIGNKEVRVLLMYAEYSSDSIMDLLFYNPQKTLQARITPEFDEAIAIIRNRYEKTIRSLNIEIFHGYTTQALDNFIEANRVDLVYIPVNYRLKIKKNGFDPLPMLKRSKLPVEQVAWEPYPDWPEKDQLSTLFTN